MTCQDLNSARLPTGTNQIQDLIILDHIGPALQRPFITGLLLPIKDLPALLGAVDLIAPLP